MQTLIVGNGALVGTIAACGPSKIARPACGTQHGFCGGVSEIGSTSRRHWR